MTNIKVNKVLGHIYELDAIRGIAAMAVLVCHLPRGFWFGETGVDLFFVLSGFLISGIILRGIEKPGFLVTFYIRRALRIFPIYYIAVLVAVCLNLFRQHPGASQGLPFYLLYLQNIQLYWGGDLPLMDISLWHTWTLAIEEQFYLIWPVALLMLKKKSSVLILVIVLFLLPFLLRSFGFSRYILLGHTDGLALGALLALFFSRSSISYKESAPIFLLLFLGCSVIYWILWMTLSAHGLYSGKDFAGINFGISILSIAYFGLVGVVVCLSGSRWLSFLRFPWLIKLGSVSYGLYLYHWIIFELLDTIFFFRLKLGQPLWLDLVKILCSICLALISWRFIESPILNLKDRFNYRTE